MRSLHGVIGRLRGICRDACFAPRAPRRAGHFRARSALQHAGQGDRALDVRAARRTSRNSRPRSIRAWRRSRRRAGGQDIKGILQEPIKIGDYRLPWEFQTSLVQSFNLMAGVGAKTQVNSAIGLNVAVTFSDPSTWPTDRTQRPPKTHDFQLLVVHLGCTGEAGVGTAAVSRPSPTPRPTSCGAAATWDIRSMGDWRIPYVWIGDGAKYAGPASPQLFFRCVLLSPTDWRSASSSMPRMAGTCATINSREYGRDHRRVGDRADHLRRPLDSRRAVPQSAAGQRAASAVAWRRRPRALRARR